ncbi:aminopeptidase [Brevibacillus ruminantium]|uniref:Aminopeptidase n=1 Tax=Brevibacillus ruminantium TaxID=2950604 RepID=A0ABY4WKL8_9BACL|nr:aminopeptidase [Brevibacillus ruminantium]USG67708.1 aminopeptidase [Brevibacillus ruminantium]
MRDPRLEELARNLVTYSVRVQPGENVLIHSVGNTPELVQALVREVYAAKGNPFVQLVNPQIKRELAKQCTEEQLKLLAESETAFMRKMDGYIGIRASDNINELSDVPADRMSLYSRLYELPVQDIRVPETKWVVLRYPNNSMAQLANMSTDAFEQFYFEVCNLDYSKMSKAMDSLVSLMNRTDRVRIVGPGTDLRFSIKDIPAVKCAGLRNIPDGEVYSAPVRDSVEGVITHNAPTPYNGFTFEQVCLHFEQGKIVKAAANDTERLNAILDTDEGARYIGEFAIGVNPIIRNPMKDILFDEKIDGSFHFTPGQCYKEAYNGNKSSVHWDMVSIQRPEWGGGEIWFDDVLIRKDGRFIIPELECLNPENLK